MKQKSCFCGEAEEHIATNGPKGTKIVQYFAFQKFVEMALKDSFQKLKKQGLLLSVFISRSITR